MNDRIHPIFKQALAGMIEPRGFDETDDGIMHDICEGPTLAEPVQSLLITLSQIYLYENSYGLDKAKAFDAILPDLKKLRQACKKLWEEKQ